ncbi:MAG: SGNH/GDSL hydrolase family protein [Thermomicrobiales bacterium]
MTAPRETATRPFSRRRLLTASTATLAAAGLSGAAEHGVFAHEASPAASPEVQEMDRAQLEGIIQFTHPQKTYGYLPGFGSDENIAPLFGIDVATYREITAKFEANALAAAKELLADAAFATRIDQLPFQPEQTVIVLGESTTDDLQSWFEILRHALDPRRPQDQIQLINLAISGQTTTEALVRFPFMLEMQPHWLLIMLGANDAMRHGRQATKPRVSQEETVKNFNEFRHLAETQSESATNLVWLTPTSVNEEIQQAYPPAQQAQFSVANDDVVPTGEALRSQFDPVVDLQATFGVPANPEFVPTDGIHPSIAGHKAIVTAVVEHLTA